MKFLRDMAIKARGIQEKVCEWWPPNKVLLEKAEQVKGYAANVSLIVMLGLIFLLSWQYCNRTLFAQVEAITQTIELTISPGEDLYWKLPAKVQGCGGQLPKGISIDQVANGTLVLAPGTSIVIARNGKGLYLETRLASDIDANMTSHADSEVSGISLESSDGTKRSKLSAGLCMKIEDLDAKETLNWALRGELTVGDDFSGSVGQQNLLLSGMVNLYQAESKGAERLPDNLILLQSRTLNLGEQLTFQRQEEPLIKPAEMVGIVRIEPDVKSLTLTAFGRVAVATTKRPLRTAEYRIKGDFVNMIFAMLRDGNQSYLLLALLVCWFLFSKHYFDK